MKLYRVIKVTKPGQANKNTKFDSNAKFKGTNGPASAAKKAMSRLCRSTVKRIRGVCTFTITVEQIKTTVNGDVPVLDSDGIPYRYMYTLKRQKIPDGQSITLDGNEVTFDYQVSVVETFGRVL